MPTRNNKLYFQFIDIKSYLLRTLSSQDWAFLTASESLLHRGRKTGIWSALSFTCTAVVRGTGALGGQHFVNQTGKHVKQC